MPIAPEARQLGTFWSWIVNSADLAAIGRDVLSAHEPEATCRGPAIYASIAATPVLSHARLLQRLGGGWFIDQAAAAGVDEQRTLAYQPDCLRPDQVPLLRRQRRVQRDQMRAAQQILEKVSRALTSLRPSLPDPPDAPAQPRKSQSRSTFVNDR